MIKMKNNFMNNFLKGKVNTTQETKEKKEQTESNKSINIDIQVKTVETNEISKSDDKSINFHIITEALNKVESTKGENSKDKIKDIKDIIKK